MKGFNKLFGKNKRDQLPSGLSRTQKNRIDKGRRIIDDHLTEKDIEGAVRDINGDPVIKPNGMPFQHYKEVDDAIDGLKKHRDSLIKSSTNPNLNPEIKKSINDVINEFDIYINSWNKIKDGK